MDEKKLMPLLMVAMVAIFFFFILPQLNGNKGTSAVSGPALKVGLPPPPSAAGIFQPPETRSMGSTDAASKTNFRVTVSNVGAGIEAVELTKYKATVGKPAPEKLLSADQGYRAFATTKITINGNGYDMLVRPDGYAITWTFDTDKRADDSTIRQVTQHVTFFDPADPEKDPAKKKEMLRVYKTFTIDDASYVMTIAYRLENKTSQPLNVVIDQLGPINLCNKPPDEFRTDSRTYQIGVYHRSKSYVQGDAQIVRQLSLTSPSSTAAPLGNFDYAGTDDRTVWIAANKRFFTIIERPTVPAAELAASTDLSNLKVPIPQAGFVSTASARPLYAAEREHPENSISGIELNGATVRVPAAKSVELPIEVYMGPKDLSTFEGDPKAPLGSFASTANSYDYVKIISFSQGGFCGFLTFSSIAMAILWALQGLHAIIPNYGVAIIILVVVIRLLLHPLTRNAQTSMAKMQRKMAKAQPELDRIKKKYPDDYQKRQTEQMRIFKEYDINPAGQIAGCAPMLLQTPIWIALYAGLAVDIHLRQAAFIPGWINDLSNPDMVWGNFDAPLFHIPLLNLPIYGLNILPLLLGAVFFINMQIQMKNQPKPQDEQQAAVQNMSKYMFFLFPLFLYNAPSGLNLYMFTSTLGGIFDTWIVRRHLREQGLLRDQNETPAK